MWTRSRFCEETERPAIPGARRYGGMTMGKGRLEAFSDGVIAIIIPIMVLELTVPHGSSLASLHELWPKLPSYVLSFAYDGIYWHNHQHVLHATDHLTGRIT